MMKDCNVGFEINPLLLKLLFIMEYHSNAKEVEQKLLSGVGSCLDMIVLVLLRIVEMFSGT